jgi:hypothetical protein
MDIGMLAEGVTPEEIVQTHFDLECEDIPTALHVTGAARRQAGGGNEAQARLIKGALRRDQIRVRRLG